MDKPVYITISEIARHLDIHPNNIASTIQPWKDDPALPAHNSQDEQPVRSDSPMFGKHGRFQPAPGPDKYRGRAISYHRVRSASIKTSSGPHQHAQPGTPRQAAPSDNSTIEHHHHGLHQAQHLPCNGKIPTPLTA